jgi:hypothetical protein
MVKSPVVPRQTQTLYLYYAADPLINAYLDRCNEEPRRKQRGIRSNRSNNRSKLRGINPTEIKSVSLPHLLETGDIGGFSVVPQDQTPHPAFS